MESTRQPTHTDRSLDLVEQVFARLQAQATPATTRLCHEDFELHWTGVGRRAHTHRGPDALDRHLGELANLWDEVEVVCDRLAETADRVLAYYRLLGRAPDGVRAESPHAAVVRVRDGRLSRWEAFQDAAHSFDWLAAEARLA